MNEPNWRDEARKISDRLHRMSAYEPCETACTHVVTGKWTILGVANVAARTAAPFALIGMGQEDTK